MNELGNRLTILYVEPVEPLRTDVLNIISNGVSVIVFPSAKYLSSDPAG
jgi:hypothetical protein